MVVREVPKCIMGHDFISGIWETKDLEKKFQEERKKAEAYYGTRDGYSGALNAIYDLMEFKQKDIPHGLSKKKLVLLLTGKIGVSDLKHPWEKSAYNRFHNIQSDICYWIKIGKNKFLWFGWARC